MRFFNTAGPCRPELHYMLPPERRMPDLAGLIDQQHYFVIHAPRQTGKTTALAALAARLTAEGRYAAVLVSAEMGAAFPDDVGKAERALLSWWTAAAASDLPLELRPPPWPDAPEGSRVQAALTAWTLACPRPLVVFIDEIDALRDDVLVSVLRQLRAGHRARPDSFPWSVALVGLRDVRDYDIKVRSLALSNFTAKDVDELYAQHTAQIGQVFERAAIDRAHALSGGQPWLVNALADEAVERMRPERSQSVRVADIDRAATVLIERQDTHLDGLSKRLREPRVRSIVEPMLAGGSLPDLPRDDLQFVVDLGLLRLSTKGGLEVANPIYLEVIVRGLMSGPRASLIRA